MSAYQRTTVNRSLGLPVEDPFSSSQQNVFHFHPHSHNLAPQKSEPPIHLPSQPHLERSEKKRNQKQEMHY